jgi:hypothetical protein
MFYIVVYKSKNSNTTTLYHIVRNSIVKEDFNVYLPDDGFLKAETCSKVLFGITNVFNQLLWCDGF